MRFYLAPCGIALGHAGRTLPVALKLKDLGHETFFSTYGDACAFVKAYGFKVAEVPSIRMFEKEDGTFDLRRTLALGPKNIYRFLLQVGAELNLIERFKPDAVISDSRLSTVIAARMLNIPSLTLLHQLRILIPHVKPIRKRTHKAIKYYVERVGLESLGALWRLTNEILVPDFPPPYTIAKANIVLSKRYEGKVRLIGPIVQKRPEELPSKEALRKKYGLDERPAVFCAISGTIPEKKFISEKLMEIFRNFPRKFQVVLSRGLPGGNNRPEKTNSLTVFNWVKDRFELLKACDVLVTRGGHNTVAEAMYFGAPMLIIPTPGHSEHQSIARSVAEMGVGELLQQRDLTFNNVLSALNRILEDPSYFKKSKEVQREALKYDALNHVIKAALSLARKEG